MNENDAQAQRGRRRMTGSDKQRDGARGRLLGLACLGLIVGGCTAGLSAGGAGPETALYSDPTDVTGSTDPAAYRGEAPSRPRPSSKTTRIALVTTSTTPAPAGRAEELTRAMSERLSALGYRLVLPPPALAPGEDLYFIAAKFAVEPSADGRGEKLGIDWLVSDALGEPVGKVSQARKLSAHPTPQQWRSETLLAAAAAAEGIAQLVPVRP